MKVIVVDTDAIIALFHKEDLHAKKAMYLLEQLQKTEAKLLYPMTTIVEATTTFQRKLSQPSLTAQLIALIKSSQLMIEPVDANLLQEAIQLFRPEGSKQNTLFDAIVAATAKVHNADAIFSFDAWYKKLGFILVEDLFKPKIG